MASRGRRRLVGGLVVLGLVGATLAAMVIIGRRPFSPAAGPGPFAPEAAPVFDDHQPSARAASPSSPDAAGAGVRAAALSRGVRPVGSGSPVGSTPAPAAATAGAWDVEEEEMEEEPVEPPTGRLAAEEIRAAIDEVIVEVKRCYEEALLVEPTLSGRVVVAFEIGADSDGDGVVESGEVEESETANPFFDACVLEQIRGLAVPAPEGGNRRVQVRYPFTFRSQSEDERR